ncbi:MAG: winged helix-turn-helix domain-containing protein [Colwellia sp.]|nr:winged helix-turn-helix domain-containing protein [Colwellia sp.]
MWAGSLVTDNAINKLVANLRKVLADEPKNPRYIQTCLNAVID